MDILYASYVWVRNTETYKQTWIIEDEFQDIFTLATVFLHCKSTTSVKDSRHRSTHKPQQRNRFITVKHYIQLIMKLLIKWILCSNYAME